MVVARELHQQVSSGGAPGEAISDSVEEAHRPTDPDAPADVIDIDDAPRKS